MTWTVKAALLYLTILVLISLLVLYSMIPFRAAENNRVVPGLWSDQSIASRWRIKSSALVSCKIPSLDPFDKAIVKTKLPPENWKVNCSSSRVFSIESSEWNLIQHSRQEILKCCYRQMTPHPKPKPASYSRVFTYRHIDPTLLPWYSPTCTQITSKVTKIPAEFEFISIECIRRNNKSSANTTILIRDMFAFVPKKIPKSKRAKEVLKGGSSEGRSKPSILILGLDQISHMQFIRHFPSSFEFLTKNLPVKAMFGYNKVDQTTLPNVATMLTGRSLDELSQSCWNHSFISFFDDCPFIWKNFSQNGFLTSYAEDKMPYSIFYNRLYARRGFRHQPTDYFYNFLGMQISQLITNKPMCIRDRLEFQNMLDYVKSTAKVLKSSPYFQFAWASSLFTKSYNYAKNGDQPLYTTLKYLYGKKLMDNTILILLSDHGYRFSPLVELRQGRFESKMPLFLTIFPESFSSKYPTAISNFEENSYRLTTPFDVFETLKDLVNPDENLGEESMLSREVPLGVRGTSLFLPVPLNRTCEGAGIDPNHCICRETRPLKFFEESEIVAKFTKKVITEINGYLSNYYNSCAQLELNDGFRSSVSVVIPEDRVGTVGLIGKKEYLLLKENIPGHFPNAVRPRLLEILTNGGNFSEVLVTVQTVPGLGIFEGRLKLQRRTWVVQDVLRLNEYNLQSHCVPLYKLKSFCYCKKQILA
ncbi:unnamed protein product [Allacma fusca]|uniref:DUF229 domain containing protein n=1 Tax=Allacma fusca TaxID=39272 RepID=A0A8J2P007_9HEXA|nr:unnamed protein product [Allacma fusca]